MTSFILTLLLLVTSTLEIEKLKVQQENGEYYELDYLESEVFQATPSEQKQQPLGLIEINQKKVEELVDGMSTKEFFIMLYEQREKQLSYQAEYVYYNNKYGLDWEVEEFPICVISPFHNFFRTKQWEGFLECLQKQNYTNFNVVMSDDMSTDNSTEATLQNVHKNYPRLSRRLTIVRNREYVEMMGNHDIQIRNHCGKETLILQLDGDDMLLGRQVFNLFNRFYHTHKNAWFVYSNFLYLTEKGYYKFQNWHIPYDVIANGSYRAYGHWMSSHIKTYWRSVYMKIPVEQLLRKPGKYHLLAADIHNIVPIVQLSGYDRVFYLDELNYYYTFNPGCGFKINPLSQRLVRIKPPFLRLDNIDDPVQRQPNFKTPIHFVTEFNERLKDEKTIDCVSTLHAKINDSTYLVQLKVPEELKVDNVCFSSNQAYTQGFFLLAGVTLLNISCCYRKNFHKRNRYIQANLSDQDENNSNKQLEYSD